MEKLDIDKELERIIEKYELDRHYPAYRVSRQASNFIRKWVRGLAETGREVLFLSMDEHALKLISGWARTENIRTLLIGAPKELENHKEILSDANKIYIVSYTGTIELLHWLWRHGFQAESVYDILENEGIYLQMEFYRFFTPLKMSQELQLDGRVLEKSVDGSFLVLYEYYYQKKRIGHGMQRADRKRIGEKLFFLSICMRNFIEAEKILNTMTDEVRLVRCWDEVRQLLSQIKERISLTRREGIVIYWLDALSYEDAPELAYLQNRREHSVYFHNAYTATPYTKPTCKNMFCEMHQVDDFGYRVNHIGKDNSPLLKNIMDQGYQFELISDCLSVLFPSEYNHCTGLTRVTPCSEVFWNLLRVILQSEQKTVYLAHAFLELHLPMLSVRRDSFEKQYATRAARKEQNKELDAQLRFYDELLGDGFYRIYMSDHGYEGGWKWFHVHFQVYHASWEAKEIMKLFCLLDFNKIMCRLLKKQKVDELAWDREYVPIQDVGYYNKNNLRTLLNEKTGIDLKWLFGYRGVIKDGIYLRMKTGEELFYEQGQEKAILLEGTKKELAYFKELRKLAGESPKELDLDSKFQYTTYAYKAYENVKNTVCAIEKLLNEKFAMYAEGSVALRMGGEHSRQLYGLLTETNKKKIGGIIDKSKQCICAKLEIPIFEPGERLPDTIQAILLSSKIYLEELKEESRSLYGRLEVMDIYQYWEQRGYLFKREFYFGRDEDYEVGFPED